MTTAGMAHLTLRQVRTARSGTVVNLVLAVVASLTLAGIALMTAADEASGWTGFESADTATFLALFPLLPVTGAMLARRRPDNAIGWLFLAAAVCIAISAFAHGYGDYALYANPGALPAAAQVTWWGWTGWVGFVLLAVFLPLLFPTGQLPSAAWRPAAWLAVAAAGSVAVAIALRPGGLTDFPDTPNPYGVAGLGDPLDALERAATPVLLVALGVAVLSLVVRYRAGDATLRRQTLWVAWVGGVLIAVDVVGNLMLGGGISDHPAYCTWGAATAKPVYGTVLPVLLLAGLPAAVGVAVLRRNLYSLDRVVRRSAVYATLWIVIAAVFVGFAWSLGVTATGRVPVALSVALTIAATMAFQPARAALERVADRWVFGRRADGQQPASEVGAERGPAAPPRRRGDRRQLRHLLAHEAALSAENLAQATELAASRARIVEAAEAERRRLERDIHDGAQQELVAMMAKLRIALDQAGSDSAAAPTLRDLQHDAKAALAGIRALAQGIHPAVLSDEGLVAAVHARTMRLPLSVEVLAEPELERTRFADAVEGGAFFVVSEALANVLKHSDAQRATVRLAVDDRLLRIEIVDDGAGFDPAAVTGNGLTRLADRVAGLGGSLQVDSGPGGTTVRARIPV
ncbi:MAG: sensor histidine kinase [Sporichthyaceae bacterium]